MCHAGHDTKFLGYGRSYCDCGESNCGLFLESQDVALKCLRGRSSSSIALDEDGRISGTKESGLSITAFEVKTPPLMICSMFHFLSL